MSERDLFIAALERDDPAERDAYLAQSCGSDPILRRRLERLLGMLGHVGSFLEQPAFAPGENVGPQAGDYLGEPNDANAPGIRTADPAPVPPAAFGRYQVRRTLGAGGCGAVYLGHDTQLNRPVAIKVLRAAASLAETADEPALQEARRLAHLRHPGIVAVHDVGVHEGRVYVVSDYLDGPDLGHWLRDNRPAWPEAARIAAAVADALAHAHARRIVHRDVKPTNILLTAERAPVLVDFGVALDEAQAGGAAKGIVSGTPWYMSPEQVAGAAHRIDGRTDIYSLGVVLYEMLTGRAPFQATGLLELTRQVRDDDPQPPRQLLSDIPPELERVCLKALAKRQQDRYTSAADFADDLRRVITTAAEGPASRQPPVGTSTGAPHPAPPASPSPQADAPPPSRRRAREAERRQVTVLVCGCGLFETEPYLEHLDMEARAGVLQAFRRACELAVFRFDGAIEQCSEEGLVACFGYPVAYEDAARRAARAGLDILETLKGTGEQLRRQHNLELTPWVGLHTGPAVVEARRDAVSLVGEARTVAIRLRDWAESGGVICTDTTHPLIKSEFDSASLGCRKIKGTAQPIELFRVIGVGVPRSPVDAMTPAGLTPLIGRDHKVSLLKVCWEQAKEGSGQIVLLIGEPGLGKSRLVYTMKQLVLGQMVEGEVDAPVIEWRCSPHYQNTGLYPAIDFYERGLGLRHDEPPEVRFDRVLHRLEQYGLARPDTVPLWASLLSLPTPDRFPPLSLSPVRQREETFRAMLEWLHVRAARKPILFVVEDLQWVDASTLEFLGQFVAEGLHDSILTLLTFRPEFQTPWPALAHQTSLALSHLNRCHVGEMMRHIAGAAVPEALVEQVFDRTSGVPLFVEEFTKIVLESGVRDQAGEGGTLTRTLAAHEIPATLQDLIMARLDRMGGEREVAQLAAVLGREFSYELLAAVATLDESTLQAELAKLVQAEILYPKGRPPQCSYIFRHALLEDGLYNSLVKAKGQQFHRRIAEVLEARFPEITQTRPELLGHHFTEAGLTAQAISYWLKAGLRSRERSADVEAIGHLKTGLALLGKFDESPERDAQELQFLNLLGPAYIASRGYAAPEVGPVFGRARELCERVGEPAQRFVAIWEAWAWHATRGDLRHSMEVASEAMAFAELVDDPGLKTEALFLLGFTMFHRADFAGARDYYRRALADYDHRQRTKQWTAHTGQDSGVTHRNYLTVDLWHLGYPDQALNVNREARMRALALGQPYALAGVAIRSSWLYQHCRLGAAAVAAADEGMAIAAEQGFPYWRAQAMILKATGILQQGRPEEALPLLLKGLDAYRATSSELTLPCYLSILGDAYVQVGHFQDARKTLEEGLAVAEKNDDRSQEAELHRLKGLLYLAETDDQAAAEGCFCTAIETARRQQSRAWELRATMSLARLWQRQGRRDEARAALTAVYGTYTEGFTTPDLVDAAALLKALA
jgi:predicted ATPase